MNQKAVKIIAPLIMLAGALPTLLLMTYAGTMFRGGIISILKSLLSLHSLLMMLWAISPFLYTWWATLKEQNQPKRQITYLIVSIVLVCLADYMYYGSVMMSADAQGALIFLFLPLYMNIALGILKLVLIPFKKDSSA